jgi:hypothetical protein
MQAALPTGSRIVRSIHEGSGSAFGLETVTINPAAFPPGHRGILAGVTKRPRSAPGEEPRQRR